MNWLEYLKNHVIFVALRGFCWGSGDDFLVGGFGQDLVFGFTDFDVLYGGVGDDDLYGGSQGD